MGTGKRARHLVEASAVRCVMRVLYRLPPEYALRVGAALGWIAFNVLGIRRRVTRDNLRRTVGRGWGTSRIDGVGCESYENFGRSIVEFTRLPLIDRAYVERFITFEGLDNLDLALAGGKGAVFITGHFGSWELLGAALCLLGYPINFLVGEQHNLRIDRLMNDLRRSCGIGIVPLGMGLRTALRKLRRNEVIALLADQDMGRRGVMIDFLGRPSSTARGPAVMAFKTGAPMVSAAIIRRRGPYHRVVIRPPLSAVWPGERPEDLPVRYTQAHADILAELIRQHPSMWFWPHRRWKTQPREKGALDKRELSAA